MSKGKFQLGEVVMTVGVSEVIGEGEMMLALARHHNGDWGDLSEDDKKQNDEALKVGDRLLSSYISSKGVKFWIITEWDRSVTTILLPEEY